MIKALLFDLDGTLIDTLEDIADSMNCVLKKHTLPTHAVQKYRYFVGGGVKTLVEKAVPEHIQSNKEIDDLVNELKIEYNKRWDDKTCLYHGIKEMFDEIKKMELKTGIISNKPDNFTKLCAQKFLSWQNFDIVKGITDNGIQKPDKKIGEYLTNKLNLASNEIILIGDTNVDMQTAVNCNFYGIGVTWGFRDEKELQEAGAYKIITHPKELLEIVKNLRKKIAMSN